MVRFIVVTLISKRKQARWGYDSSSLRTGRCLYNVPRFSNHRYVNKIATKHGFKPVLGLVKPHSLPSPENAPVFKMIFFSVLFATWMTLTLHLTFENEKKFSSSWKMSTFFITKIIRNGSKYRKKVHLFCKMVVRNSYFQWNISAAVKTLTRITFESYPFMNAMVHGTS